jgi:hypothetical protein
MKSYASNEEFFHEIKSLIEQLALAGQDAAAQELRQGLSSLNGLTDGWALLMESMENVALKYGTTMGASRAEKLHAMLAVVRKVVYR